MVPPLLLSRTILDMFCPGLTYLPDGRLMVTGGSNSEKTSIYDPQVNRWNSDTNMNIPRGM